MANTLLNLSESHTKVPQESNLSFTESADRWNETTLGNLGSQPEKNGASVRQGNTSRAARTHQNGGLGSTAGEVKSGHFKGANESDDEDAIRLANGDHAAEKKPLIYNSMLCLHNLLASFPAIVHSQLVLHSTRDNTILHSLLELTQSYTLYSC